VTDAPADAEDRVEPQLPERQAVIALVGRPNVGKSSLFNALTYTRDALVADFPGLTRDRHYGVVRRGSEPFILIDTGGITDTAEKLTQQMRQQALKALDEADVVVLLLDGKDGVLGGDRDIAQLCREAGKQALLVVNKIDVTNQDVVLNDAFSLGLGAALTVSAAHKQGLEELTEALIEAIPAELRAPPAPEPEEEDPFAEPSPEDVLTPAQKRKAAELERLQGPLRVTVVGRPNAGKSTLINRLLGDERLIASDLPGTTRDAIDVAISRDGRDYVFVDTAGIRRKSKVNETIEKFSVVKTLHAIQRSHVAVLLLDAHEGIADQDAAILGHILDAGRALVIAVNKWDGLRDDQRSLVERELERRLDFCSYAQRVFISGLHGSGLRELMRAINQTGQSLQRKFSSKDLSDALALAQTEHQAPMSRGRSPKLRHAHIGSRLPLSIVIHGSKTATLPDSYKRYLEGFFRAHFRLVGTPIRLEFRDGENPYAGKKNELTDRQVRRKRRLIRHVKGS
jgi:GTPase